MKTSSEWLHYYQQNPHTLLAIPWERGAELTAEERAVIARSVQEFQLGESSEGRHLLQDAADYAARTGDHLYLQTMRFSSQKSNATRPISRASCSSMDCPSSRRPGPTASSDLRAIYSPGWSFPSPCSCAAS